MGLFSVNASHWFQGSVLEPTDGLAGSACRIVKLVAIALRSEAEPGNEKHYWCRSAESIKNGLLFEPEIEFHLHQLCLRIVTEIR